MTRNRKSARDAGAALERLVADYLSDTLADDRIDRRVKRGQLDRGDIGGVRTALGERVVLEIKNTARMDLPGWMAEAAVEAANDDAPVYAVVHKRHGKGAAAEQWVTLTLAQFARLIGGDTCITND